MYVIPRVCSLRQGRKSRLASPRELGLPGKEIVHGIEPASKCQSNFWKGPCWRGWCYLSIELYLSQPSPWSLLTHSASPEIKLSPPLSFTLPYLSAFSQLPIRTASRQTGNCFSDSPVAHFSSLSFKEQHLFAFLKILSLIPIVFFFSPFGFWRKGFM